jgi:hypothetical protein
MTVCRSRLGRESTSKSGWVASWSVNGLIIYLRCLVGERERGGDRSREWSRIYPLVARQALRNMVLQETAPVCRFNCQLDGPKLEIDQLVHRWITRQPTLELTVTLLNVVESLDRLVLG